MNVFRRAERAPACQAEIPGNFSLSRTRAVCFSGIYGRKASALHVSLHCLCGGRRRHPDQPGVGADGRPLAAVWKQPSDRAVPLEKLSSWRRRADSTCIFGMKKEKLRKREIYHRPPPPEKDMKSFPESAGRTGWQFPYGKEVRNGASTREGRHERTVTDIKEGRDC